jgi:capsular polysaccharide transport system ATP-binding protein
MIEVVDVTKEYTVSNRRVRVLDRANLVVKPGQKVGILGRNGAGKSTIVRLISGVELPTSGTVTRSMSVSWPLAFGGAFQTAMTGFDNLRFICRIYGVDYRDCIDYVQDFSELGSYMREPIKSYSSGMRARLAFAISMTVNFDCYLIDEVIAVGDARFHEKCLIELFEKRANKAKVIVSHDVNYVRAHCHNAAVISQGKLSYFEEVDDAFDFYKSVDALRVVD